jgi:predicted nuclease of predicted toxin-antitoxin system
MKLLLDENMPQPFRHDIPGHDVRTADYMGWKGRVNGELLALARDEFDVIITLDQKIEKEQNLTDADVAVVILRPGTDDIRVLRTLVPQILERMLSIRRGQIIHIPSRE